MKKARVGRVSELQSRAWSGLSEKFHFLSPLAESGAVAGTGDLR